MNQSGVYAAHDRLRCVYAGTQGESRSHALRVEHLAGLQVEPEPPLISACIYCDPQMASMCQTKAAARVNGHQVGRSPLQSNGMALALGKVEGFIKKPTWYEATGESVLAAFGRGHSQLKSRHAARRTKR